MTLSPWESSQGYLDICPSARGYHFPTVEFVVGIDASLNYMDAAFAITSAYMFPRLITMLTLRLAVLLLAILALVSLVKPHWILRIFAYIQRNCTTSEAIASLIDEVEEQDHRIQRLFARSNAANPLPEDALQCLAKLSAAVRRYQVSSFLSRGPLVDVLWSCVVLMKVVQNSPGYAGLDKALEVFGELKADLRVSIPTQQNIRISDRFQTVENLMLEAARRN